MFWKKNRAEQATEQAPSPCREPATGDELERTPDAGVLPGLSHPRSAELLGRSNSQAAFWIACCMFRSSLLPCGRGNRLCRPSSTGFCRRTIVLRACAFRSCRESMNGCIWIASRVFAMRTCLPTRMLTGSARRAVDAMAQELHRYAVPRARTLQQETILQSLHDGKPLARQGSLAINERQALLEQC